MNRNRKWLIGAIFGALLTCAPLFGLLGTALGMAKAFHALGKSGIADPQGVTAGVHASFIATAAGLVLCPIGIILLIVSLVLLIRTGSGSPAEPSSLHGTPHV